MLGSEAPSRARQRVRKDDVLVSTVRPNLNAVAKVPKSLDAATASTGFCVLRPRQGSIDAAIVGHTAESCRQRPRYLGLAAEAVNMFSGD